MKTALLVCDHVAKEFEKEHGTYPHMFRQLLKIPFDPYYVCDGEFPEVTAYDAFLTTGSRFSVYDQIDWVRDLLALIREIYQSGKKLVGVCFGHQLIAEALGGEVRKADTGYLIGVNKFQVIEKQPWMDPSLDETYHILMLCQDQVNRLPKDSKILASSPSCPIGMYTVRDQFLGIQGHPEFTKAYNRAVFESRSERIGNEKVMLAILSMDGDIDREALANTMVRFLRA